MPLGCSMAGNKALKWLGCSEDVTLPKSAFKQLNKFPGFQKIKQLQVHTPFLKSKGCRKGAFLTASNMYM